MSHRHREHARQVVHQFNDMLSPSGREHVGQRHFDELALLVEAAISSAVLEEMEGVADRLEALAREMRNQAEHFDTPATD